MTMEKLRIVLAGCAALLALLAAPYVFSQGTAGEITGYFWSDTIGWVSLNCQNHGTCGTSNYRLAVDSAGVVTGYAWSDNVGWISANSADLAGCPSGTCAAQFVDGNLTGWMRAIAGGTPQSGGWDGFIRLYSVSPAYGVTESGGILSGYAWGDTVMGWLDASYAVTTYEEEPPCADTAGYYCDGLNSRYLSDQCVDSLIATCSYACHATYGACIPAPSPEGELTVSPSIVIPGETVIVSWDIDDATTCTVTEDNDSIDDSWSGLAGSEESSPIDIPTTYTLQCDGLEGLTLTATARVNFRPDWQEI